MQRKDFRGTEAQIRSIQQTGWKEHETESGYQDSTPGFATRILWGVGQAPHPPHPNEGVIPEDLKASCSVLCCCDFWGGGVELGREGALKEVSVGQDLEEGRVVDTEEGDGISH